VSAKVKVAFCGGDRLGQMAYFGMAVLGCGVAGATVEKAQGADSTSVNAQCLTDQKM